MNDSKLKISFQDIHTLFYSFLSWTSLFINISLKVQEVYRVLSMTNLGIRIWKNKAIVLWYALGDLVEVSFCLSKVSDLHRAQLLKAFGLLLVTGLLLGYAETQSLPVMSWSPVAAALESELLCLVVLPDQSSEEWNQEENWQRLELWSWQVAVQSSRSFQVSTMVWQNRTKQ